jgi:ABC-type uncharacterized transport system YnjBCD ATPase subunit
MQFKVQLNHPAQSDPDSTIIALSPTDTRWNDFGYNFHAYAKFIPNDHRDPIRVRLFVIPFDDNGKPETSFYKWHSEKSNVKKDRARIRLDLPNTFNSMIASEGDYQSLYDWCEDAKDFHEALGALHEISWLADQPGIFADIARSTTASPAFQLGVIRTGAAYRAFRRGYARSSPTKARILEARVPFKFETHLDGFESAHKLNVRFHGVPIVSDRVHCIVGPNGTGKSRLLASMVDRLSTQELWSGMEVSDEDAETPLPSYNRVLAYTSEVDGLLPTRLASASTLDYQHFSLTAPIKDPAQDKRDVSMARMLIDLVREEPGMDELDRYSLFKRSLGKHVDLSTMCIPLTDDANDAIVFRDTDSRKWARFSELHSIGEQRRLEVTGALDQRRELSFFSHNGTPIRISSGQRAFTRFALHFLTFSDMGMLVVMDEPETHLHPNLVSAFCLLLNDVLSLTSSIALVATHSVFVVRESITSCNHIVEIDEEGQVVIEHVYMKTLGASPTSLSISIFGDDLAKKYHATLVREISGLSLTMEQVIEKYGKYLSMDMLMEIRSRIVSTGSDQ